MLQQLIESRARPVRRRGGGAVSVAVHALAVGLAVVATARAAPLPPEAPPDLVFVAPTPPAEAPARATAARRTGARSPSGSRSPAFSPPLEPQFPVVDLAGALPAVPGAPDTRPLVDAGEFARGGLGSGSAGAGLGSGPPGDGPMDAAAVDEPVVADPRNRPPRYPEALRAAGAEGRVVARFVVDTLGRVEGATVRIIAADEPRFEASVREALGRMRFRPARAGGVRVRQLVELPFAFALGGGGGPR